MFDPTSAPIPGQSWTAEPKSRPWEKPPEYTNPDKAFTFLFESMTEPKKATGLLNLLEADVPAASLAEILLMTGVMEGKWTVDLAMLLLEPTMWTLVRMAESANIKLEPPEDDEYDDSFMLLARAKEGKVSPAQVTEATKISSPPMGGLMSPEGVM